MSGNKLGGLKIKATLIAKLGEEGYKRLVVERGRKGGSAPKTRPSGFAAMDKERRIELGRKGGTKSRRGSSNESL